MSSDLSLIAASTPQIPKFALTVDAIEKKDLALASSALIGRVTNAVENTSAVEAMKRLKAISSAFEAERKRLTEPLLDAQRQLKRVVDTERDEIDREIGRLEGHVKEFVLAEQKRVREEQEAQQRELDRIERERLAALAKAETPEQKQMINENADLRARIESAPPEITRAAGQTNRKVWKITRINDFQLMKARPDLVRKVEWDMLGIKEILNAGGALPGVTAEEDLKISTRGGVQKAIEV